MRTYRIVSEHVFTGEAVVVDECHVFDRHMEYATERRMTDALYRYCLQNRGQFTGLASFVAGCHSWYMVILIPSRINEMIVTHEQKHLIDYARQYSDDRRPGRGRDADRQADYAGVPAGNPLPDR